MNMNIAIILSAGIGSRMKNALPKQFIEINNKPLFILTLEKFLSCNLIDKIYLVINKDYKQNYLNMLDNFHYQNKVSLIEGGNSRQESVFNALNKINANEQDIVLIHDGARPLVSQRIIKENILLCQKTKKPISTVIKFVDTIIDKEYNLLDKNSLLAVQTPQTFPYELIKKLHLQAQSEKLQNVSDDAQLAKKYGYKVDYVLGSRINIKITEQEDLALVKLLENVGED